jgi:hypothetical protein
VAGFGSSLLSSSSRMQVTTNPLLKSDVLR